MNNQGSIKLLMGMSFMVLATLMPSSLLADVSLEYSNPENAKENMVLTVTNSRAAVRFSDGSGEETRMIYDQGEDKLFMVMDSRKQYMDMDAMMETLGGLSDMLSGMMKDLPADTQGQLGDLLGGMLGKQEAPKEVAKAELKETGEKDEIAGFSCSIVTMDSNDQSTELCLAKPEVVGVSAADFTILQAMLAKQSEAAKKASDMVGMRDIGFNPGDIDRMPLRIRQLAGAGAGSVSELQAVLAEVDSNAVVIPSEYTAMQMPGQ